MSNVQVNDNGNGNDYVSGLMFFGAFNNANQNSV
jgi:hypothetical protein